MIPLTWRSVTWQRCLHFGRLSTGLQPGEGELPAEKPGGEGAREGCKLNYDSLKFLLETGEGQFVEFKESPDRNLAKEIAGFANASGGILSCHNIRLMPIGR